MASALRGVWHETKGNVCTPKMRVNVNDGYKVELDLINMTKAEREEIIAGVRAIYNDNFAVKHILGGVRVYAPASI